MIVRPKFKDFLEVKTIEPDNVLLFSETGNYMLTGNIYYLLSNLINGDRTIEEITKEIRNKASLAEINFALSSLEKAGYITESEPSFPTNKSAFYNFLDIEPKVAQSRLQKTKVSISTVGDINAKLFISILKSFDIQIVDRGDFHLVLTDDYLRKDLEKFNNLALEQNIPWMLIKPIGIISWIGPIFVPGVTGCWDCLSQRLRNLRKSEAIAQNVNGNVPLTKSKAYISSTLNTAINMAATEVVKWIVKGDNSKLTGKIVTFNSLSLEAQIHHLTKRPQCDCCGDSEKYKKIPQPLCLQSRIKSFTKDGGHRIASPEKTFKQYQHHISPITGIVSKLKKSLDVDGEHTHAYSAGQNLALASNSLNSLRNSLRSSNGGKGLSDTQAKVSCLCESLERYSGVFHGYEPRIKSSYENLGSQAIHPNSCMNFSAAQYQKRDRWNRNLDSHLNWIPVQFDEKMEIEWTPVWSLTNQVFKYLPTGYCYYNYPVSEIERNFYFPCSNGNAAGNSLEEAVLQGFLELVERDSVAIWWYNRLKKTKVDLDSFDEPQIKSIRQYYQSIRRDLWVLDLTSDLNIPVFVAISRRIDKPVEDIIFGFGCHFDAKVAILRAITELNQFLPAVLPIDSNGKEKYLINDKAAINWWKTATIANQSYLAPDRNIPLKLYSDYSQTQSDDLLDDVRSCVDISRKNGMEVLVLDQTRPDIELNVVKVIVPGLRHFWARFAPGRLYDIPVKLGCLEKPLSEEQLNPFSIFV